MTLKLIFDYYAKEIRPLTEQAVVVWNSGLTKAQSKDLEKVQKVALKIITGDLYTLYEVACELFNIDQLGSRRSELCINFAIKPFMSDRSNEFFTRNKVNNRIDKKNLVKKNISRTTRCYNAPHNYLARLVNQNKHKFIMK